MGAANDSRAFVFGRSGGSWAQVARLTPAPFGLFFGYSVALDGRNALVGADGDVHAGSFSGSAYFFELDIQQPPPLVSDIDGDGDVDLADIGLISAARNQPASGPNDPRDLNGDGRIDALDARIAVTKCTRPRCALQ